MSKIAVTRRIHASVEYVFKTISDIQHYSRAVPSITNVEFLTENKSGMGTRFIQTREVGGRKISAEIQITEYVEDEHLRLVSDIQDIMWDAFLPLPIWREILN